MIYQLVKWNLGWLMGILMAGFIAVVYLLYPRPGNQFEMIMPLCLLYILPRRQFFSVEPCTVFEASLPIHGRQIFCGRMLALGTFIWLPAFAAALARLVRNGQAGWSDARLVLEIGATFSVLVALVPCLRAGKLALSRQSRWFNLRTFVSYLAALALGAGVIPHLPAHAVFAVCAAAVGALLWYGWARTPEAFEFVAADEPRAFGKRPPPSGEPHLEAVAEANRDIVEAQQDPAQVAQTSKPGWSLLACMPLLRTVFSTLYAAVFIVPMASLFGLWGLPLLAFFIGGTFVNAHRNMPWLYTIPISRHRVFALLMLPLLVLMIGGVALKSTFFGINGRERLVKDELGPFWETYSLAAPRNVKVPVAYWLRARTGEAPLIQAPWGEQYQPQTYTLFGLALYNPYSVGAGNSQQFFDWQFERAIKAVYGSATTRSEYETALLSGPPVAQQLRIAALTLTAIIATCLLVVYIFQFGWWYRVRRRTRTVVVAVSLCLLAFGVTVWMGGVAPQFGTYEMQSGKLLADAALIWCARVLPQNPAAFGGVLLGFIGLLYWIVDRQFCELELSLLPRIAQR